MDFFVEFGHRSLNLTIFQKTFFRGISNEIIKYKFRELYSQDICDNIICKIWKKEKNRFIEGFNYDKFFSLKYRNSTENSLNKSQRIFPLNLEIGVEFG